MAEDNNSVAVTGMSCRFPGDADSLSAFWEFICAGRSAYSENSERWSVDAFHHPTKKPNASITRGAHYLKQDIAAWDANFFGISKSEAESIDPQQRIMIEVAYEAMESAGLPMHKMAGSRTGVYIGSFTSDYRELVHRDSEAAPPYTLTGTSNTSTSNRISWFFDLKGPSFTMNTACSSSLVALHLACQSLRTGETDYAIVGGASLLLNPDIFMFLSNQGFLAKDGKCKSFDASGDGYGRGDGFAAVILRRADDAIRDGDPLRAVVRMTGSNQDGRTKGFTLPSAEAQANLTRETYQKAGLSFDDTNYVEAHGTGTKAGDSGETKGLAETIGSSHSPVQPLLIGSVKSNIGHLEGCAGLAGFIKAVLVTEKGLIPPTIHLNELNPTIPWDEYNIEVPTKLTPWHTEGIRRVSTQGFGYGGTNAHAIIDDAQSYLEGRSLTGHSYTRSIDTSLTLLDGHGAAESRPRLFMLSAQDKDGLPRVERALADHLKHKATESSSLDFEEAAYLQQLAYTLHERRSKLQWSSYVVASNLDDLVKTLSSADDGALQTRAMSHKPRVGFVFTGQGAQWARMGQDLMSDPVFRNSIEAADRYLQKLGCAWSASDELASHEGTSNIHGAEYSQTLCTVLQVALVDLARSWDIAPTAVAGHSSGEIAAAYCTGAISAESAWKIAYCRGVFSAQLKDLVPGLQGAMMAVGTSAAQTEEYIKGVSKGDVCVACVNSPTGVTVSGDATGIDQLEQILKEKGVIARKLKTDGTAYHSDHMQIIAHLYLDAIAEVETLVTDQSECTMHSSVFGGVVENDDLTPVYWIRNLNSPVLFADAVKDMVRPGKATENALDIIVEIGPHSALQGPVTQTLKHYGIKGVEYFSLLSRDQNDAQSMLSCAGALHALGLPVNLRQANEGANTASKPLIDLPSYPWNHTRRFWSETRMGKQYRTRSRPPSPLIGAPHPTLVEGEYLWRGFFRSSEEPWIKDHGIQGQTLYPAAGFLAMAIEAMLQIADHGKVATAVKIREVQVTSALIVPEESAAEMIVQLRPHRVGTRASTFDWYEFVVSSSTDEQDLRQNSVGLIAMEYEPMPGSPAASELQCEAVKAIQLCEDASRVCANSLPSTDFYSRISELGLQYGETFAKLSDVRHGPQISSCQLKVAETSHEHSKAERPWLIHPATLDAAFHLAFAAMLSQEGSLKGAMVPTRIDEVTVSANIAYEHGAPLSGTATVRSHGMREIVSDIIMLNEEKTGPVIRVAGLHLADVSGESQSSENANSPKKICFGSDWRPIPEVLSPSDLQRHMMGPSKSQTSQSGIGTLAERLIEYLLMQDHGSVEHGESSVLEIEIGHHDVAPVALLPSASCFTKHRNSLNYTLATRNQERQDAVHASYEALSGNAQDKIIDFSESSAKDVFGDKKFDLICLVDTRAQCSQIDGILDNIAHLLKADGRVCLVEVTKPASSYRSTLDGTGKDWSSSIADAKFAADFHVHDVEDKTSQQLCMTVFSKPGNTNMAPPKFPEHVVILESPEPSKHATAVANYVQRLLEEKSIAVERVSWPLAIASRLDGKSCLSLLELDQSILFNPSSGDFETVKTLITKSAELLWATKLNDAARSLASGLFRSIRNEIPGAKLRSLELKATSTSKTAAEIIVKTLGYSGPDNEFRVIDGYLCSSRIIEAPLEDQALQGLLADGSKKPVMMRKGDVPVQLKLAVRTPGVLDSICFERDNLPNEPLETGQVEIEVKASGMNFREVMVALGQIPDDKLGFDCAGYIHRMASDVTKVQVGDRVAAMSHGAHRTMHRVAASLCEKIPDTMSFEEASTIPVVGGTAWYGLVKLAQVQPGQSILIHAAAGGVGQSAIMLAKHLKQEIFATVSSEEKRELLRSTYGIPDDHIFNSRDLSFAKGIKRMTDGKGVDTVLNSLSGEALRQSFWCLAPFGTFLEIGIKDILNNSRLDMAPFREDITFSFFDLNHIAMRKPALMSEILQNVFDLIRRDITQPVSLLTVYSASEVEKAFRQMQTGKHLGKIAIKYSDDDMLPVLADSLQSKSLNAEAVYLMVGGLGGAGRSLATLLARLGAKKLCILSRSGSKSQHAVSHLEMLRDLRVQANIYECDVGDESSLRSAVQRCSSELGEIKGVIQGAMSLQDSLFEKMTYEQWIKSLRPKVQGTRNLHNVLPRDLDFFVILSSFAGIFGNRGQSNYAAAGAFQDSIAHVRPEAVAIDLGILRDVGVLAEGGITDNLRAWEEPFGIREKELHALVERAIVAKKDMPKQLLTGLATSATVQAAGIDLPFYLESDPRFRKLARSSASADSTSSSATSAVMSITARLATAQSLSAASEIVCEAITSRIAKILQTSVSEIDTSRPLHAYGIDSLVAVELGHWIHKELQSNATVFDLMSSSPLTVLSNKIAGKSTAIPKDLS